MVSRARAGAFVARSFGFFLVAAATGCPAEDVRCTGDTLFGRPVAATGLTPEQCAPTCTCGDTWSPPVLTGSDIPAYRFLGDFPMLAADPYDEPAPTIPEDAVCGLRVGPDGYNLQTFDSLTALEESDAILTHGGPCGVCSTLTDLRVYVEHPDLTEPVRACGLMHLFGPRDEHLRCLTDLGFTEPCAQIWYFNTIHTRQVCADECFAAVDAPYHEADGRLNPCLVCDEKNSGPVFKAIAGRTRRNTGLASALCRPCRDVLRIDHRYPR